MTGGLAQVGTGDGPTGGVEVRRAATVAEILAAEELFDEPVRPEWARRFIAEPGHHLLLGYLDGRPVGMIVGMEQVHPDKAPEMFLDELGVDPAYQRRGVGRALTGALAELARERGCEGMWVLFDRDNAAARATYRSAGAGDEEKPMLLGWTFD